MPLISARWLRRAEMWLPNSNSSPIWNMSRMSPSWAIATNAVEVEG
jgi:hypothetical protein